MAFRDGLGLVGNWHAFHWRFGWPTRLVSFKARRLFPADLVYVDPSRRAMTKLLLYGGIVVALAIGLWRLEVHIESIGYDRAEAEYTKAALVASEANREKETALNNANMKVTNDFLAHKKLSAAAAVVSTDKLRDLQATLDSAASADTSAAGRTDDPAFAVAHECARGIVTLDNYAENLAGQVRGLQDYAKLLRLKE